MPDQHLGHSLGHRDRAAAATQRCWDRHRSASARVQCCRRSPAFRAGLRCLAALVTGIAEAVAGRNQVAAEIDLPRRKSFEGFPDCRRQDVGECAPRRDTRQGRGGSAIATMELDGPWMSGRCTARQGAPPPGGSGRGGGRRRHLEILKWRVLCCNLGGRHLFQLTDRQLLHYPRAENEVNIARRPGARMTGRVAG